MESPPANPYASPASNPFGTTDSQSGDSVSPSTIAQLAGTKPWVRFMSVLMWIGVAFMLLAGGGMGLVSLVGSLPKNAANPFGNIGFLVMAVIYVVMAFVYIVPAVKLWKYANRIGSLAASRAVVDLDAALNEQRGFWKFVGVMTVVVLSLYLIIAIGFFAFGATAALKAGAFAR